MLYIPRDYRPILDVTETQKAIALIRSEFEKNLSAALNLSRISAPMFVRPESGLNDNLNGWSVPFPSIFRLRTPRSRSSTPLQNGSGWRSANTALSRDAGFTRT